MSVGIIIEANPFHNGHKYLINEIKKLYPNETIIGVMSTSFTMRGEISLLDKFSKIKILLSEGLDLVFELPIGQTLQSADYFSSSCVKILNQVGVDKLVVGCEKEDISIIDYFYQLIKTTKYNELLKDNLNKNLSYKKAVETTLNEMDIDKQLIELFLSPNMTLAFQYYRTIKYCYYPIELVLIKRTNNYYHNSINETNIASATDIRNMYIHNQNIDKYVPYTPSFINIREAEQKLSSIICFHLLKNEPLGIDKEGIYNYCQKNIKYNSSFTEITEQLANKKYTTSRIRRFLLSNLLSIISKNDIIYLRLIGISMKGSLYLKELPRKIKDIIFSSPLELNSSNDIKELNNEEILCTKLYGLLINDENYYLNEYKLPIKKEGK